MSNIYKGEFQDYEGNVVYPHTTADVVFATDGETIQQKLNDAGIDYDSVKAQLTSGDKEFRFGVTADGEFGYHKEVAGADTVIPFKSSNPVTLLAKKFEMMTNLTRDNINNKILTYTATEKCRALVIFSAADTTTFYLTTRVFLNGTVQSKKIEYPSDITKSFSVWEVELKPNDVIDCYTGGDTYYIIGGFFILKI